jgi:hypothetical protein
MRKAALRLDLRRLAGDARWKWFRRLRSLASWPALYPKPGIPRVFAEILEVYGLDPDPKLGDLRPPLSTAAVDVAARRLLVYPTEGNPDMTVAELLSIATAIPLVYPPHEREGREILDASLASYTPIWLATGQVERLRSQLGELLADPNVSVWYDHYIKPSSLWGPAIEDAIRCPRVAVLFVSEGFERSDFIHRVERPLLRAHLAPGRLLCISIDGTLPSGPEESLQVFANARALDSMGETEADETLKRFGRLIEQTYRAAVATT